MRFGEFEVGGSYPRPEDVDRMDRYAQARKLFEGKHYDIEEADRTRDKMAAAHHQTKPYRESHEGIVEIVFNLPRLIVTKFADLQMLNTPMLLYPGADEEAKDKFEERLSKGTPDLWARLHYAKQIQRAFGEVVLLAHIRADGSLDIRVVEPERWFPVLDPSDDLIVTAHQIAWTEEHGNDLYLRVDTIRPNRVERTAYTLRGKNDAYDQTSEIDAEIGVGPNTPWPDARPVDAIPLDGAMPIVVIANPPIRAGEIFGCPEFYDSGSLVDDVNWRLSTWSDANDRVAHAPEITPKEWISQDEDGTTQWASQYTRKFIGKGSGRLADIPEPKFMEYPLKHETLKDEFETALTSLLVRHEMAPALLGLNFSRERESGEAKSLGMGTTEAATRRDLLATQPKIEELLTIAAKLVGVRKLEVSTHWRVGLPKTQAELLGELQTKHSMGLVTKKDMLRTLYPWMDDAEIEDKLAELADERQAELAEMTDYTARTG